MKDGIADDILMTPGQPNILRGPNGFEWWLIYMANKNDEHRGNISTVSSSSTRRCLWMVSPAPHGRLSSRTFDAYLCRQRRDSFVRCVATSTAVRGLLVRDGSQDRGWSHVIAWWKDADNCAYVGLDAENRSWYLRTLVGGKRK